MLDGGSKQEDGGTFISTELMTELHDLMDFMTPKELAELDRLLANVELPEWAPFEGPQYEALNCPADILFYGGAAGGGKTDLLLGTALTRHRSSIVFRREFAQLKGIRERAEELYEKIGKFNGRDELWRIVSGQYAGKRVEFGACSTLGDEKKYQGRPHDLKGFDEITHFTEAQFRFLITWTRTTKKGQRARVICAGNPPTDAEGDWVIRYWAPWLDKTHPNPAKPGELRWFVSDEEGEDFEVPSGDPVWLGKDGVHTEQGDPEEGRELVQPKSRSFIQAKVEDNPYLMSTGYKAQLQALPEPLRSKMLKGDFGVGQTDAEWQVIPTEWVLLAQARWKPTYEEYLKSQAAERLSTEPEQDEPIPSARQSADTLEQSEQDSLGQKAWPGMPKIQEGQSGVDTSALKSLRAAEAHASRVASAGRRARRIGVDVSRGGRDRMVITVGEGTWFGTQVAVPGKEVPSGELLVMRLIALGYQDDEIRIDAGGVGTSPYDIGRLHNMNVIPMISSMESTAKDLSGKLGFVNLRAEWWWKLREALDPRLGVNLALPPDPELTADLTAPRWMLRRDGILIEDKKDIKERIHRSTDKGDSLVMAHAEPHLVGEGLRKWYEEQYRERQALAEAAKGRTGL